jgi:hypothetical protein
MLHLRKQKMAGSLPNVPRFLGAFLKAKMKKKLLRISKEAITAWLWAEDQKAMAALPQQSGSQPIVVAV